MDWKEFAVWLINYNGDFGADDEEFAEFFMYLYKLSKPKSSLNSCTKREMTKPIDKFTEWLNGCLHEIIDLDSECCQDAWWKQDED